MYLFIHRIHVCIRRNWIIHIACSITERACPKSRGLSSFLSTQKRYMTKSRPLYSFATSLFLLLVYHRSQPPPRPPAMGRSESVFTPLHAGKRKQKAKSATSETKERRQLAKGRKEAAEKLIERRRCTTDRPALTPLPLVVDNTNLQLALEEERRLHSITLQHQQQQMEVQKRAAHKTTANYRRAIIDRDGTIEVMALQRDEEKENDALQTRIAEVEREKDGLLNEKDLESLRAMTAAKEDECVRSVLIISSLKERNRCSKATIVHQYSDKQRRAKELILFEKEKKERETWAHIQHGCRTAKKRDKGRTTDCRPYPSRRTTKRSGQGVW
jgi:hypothetical protein